MCFSARMSFFAVGLLLSIAFATFRKVRSNKEIPLAGIPLIFAVQQAAEGILWILLPTGLYPSIIQLAHYLFLSIAFIIWPIYIPFSVLLLEKHFLRRSIIGLCLVLGIGWSLTSILYLIHHGATVQIHSGHISYQLKNIDHIGTTPLLLYCISTLVPCLASSLFSIRLLGCIIALSCLAAYLFWYHFFISIWCFFAALISLSVYKIIHDLHS